MIRIINLIMLGIAIVCAIALAVIVLEFVEDKVKSKFSKKINRVHFYVAKDNNGTLTLWFGKPFRGVEYWVSVGNRVLLASGDEELNIYNLKIEDYKDLKWEDEPLEVFLNMED